MEIGLTISKLVTLPAFVIYLKQLKDVKNLSEELNIFLIDKEHYSVREYLLEIKE